MSISPDAVRDELSGTGIREGNPAKKSSGLPSATSSNIFVDSSSNIEVVKPLQASIATKTDEFLKVTGSPNGDIMTQTLVAAASATTITSGGYMRVYITSDNSAIMSTGFYYIQVNTLL